MDTLNSLVFRDYVTRHGAIIKKRLTQEFILLCLNSRMKVFLGQAPSFCSLLVQRLVQ